MQSIALETLDQVAKVASSSSSLEEREASVVALVGGRELARRALDWLPEAFGFVLVTHMNLGVVLPKVFMAKTVAGCWVEIPLAKDPVFCSSLELASIMFHNGPREVFTALATSSFAVDVVNKALNAGESLAGATIQPLRMHGLAAEAYDAA